MTDTIGRRIAQRRRMQSLSQEALGEKLGVSRQAISKWEADASIPEVDKLIAMSRLFGISVGQLLGVEAPEQSDGLPAEDEQAMAEQMLMAFQTPPPAPSAEPTPNPPQPPEPKQAQPHIQWLPLACIVLAVFSLLLSIISLSRSNSPVQDTALSAELLSRLESMEKDIADAQKKDTDAETLQENLMSILNEAYNDIITLQRDVDGLFVALETAPTQKPDEQATYASLSSWSLSGNATADLSSVDLSFRCSTVSQTNGARFSVWLDGRELTSVKCTEDTDGYATQLTLPVENGYQYVLLLTHMDGGVERIALDGHGLSNLDTLTAPQLRLISGDVTADSQTQHRFWIDFSKIILLIPELTSEDAQVEWSDLMIRCYQNDLLVDEVIITEKSSVLNDVDMTQRVLSFRIPVMAYETNPFMDGDSIQLRLEGKLSIDGKTTDLTFLLGGWEIKDGKFVQTTT